MESILPQASPGEDNAIAMGEAPAPTPKADAQAPNAPVKPLVYKKGKVYHPCQLCNVKPMRTAEKVNDHMKRMHYQRKQWRCHVEYCHRRADPFREEEDLVSHITKYHTDSTLSALWQPCVVNSCDEPFSDQQRADLKEHLQRVHPDEFQQSFNGSFWMAWFHLWGPKGVEGMERDDDHVVERRYDGDGSMSPLDDQELPLGGRVRAVSAQELPPGPQPTAIDHLNAACPTNQAMLPQSNMPMHGRGIFDFLNNNITVPSRGALVPGYGWQGNLQHTRPLIDTMSAQQPIMPPPPQYASSTIPHHLVCQYPECQFHGQMFVSQAHKQVHDATYHPLMLMARHLAVGRMGPSSSETMPTQQAIVQQYDDNNSNNDNNDPTVPAANEAEDSSAPVGNIMNATTEPAARWGALSNYDPPYKLPGRVDEVMDETAPPGELPESFSQDGTETRPFVLD